MSDENTICPMSHKQFAETMAEIAAEFHDDVELLHAHQDTIMCDLLRSLGYGAGIDVFNNTDKWYA